MRRASWLFITPLVLVLGCNRPEVEAFKQRPAPVSVTVSLPSGLENRDSFQKEYASALRARLATRVVVVPEGVKPPVGTAELQVDIRDISLASSEPSAAAVGVAEIAAFRCHGESDLGLATGVLRAGVQLAADGLLWRMPTHDGP